MYLLGVSPLPVSRDRDAASTSTTANDVDDEVIVNQQDFKDNFYFLAIYSCVFLLPITADYGHINLSFPKSAMVTDS